MCYHIFTKNNIFLTAMFFYLKYEYIIYKYHIMDSLESKDIQKILLPIPEFQNNLERLYEDLYQMWLRHDVIRLMVAVNEGTVTLLEMSDDVEKNQKTLWTIDFDLTYLSQECLQITTDKVSWLLKKAVWKEVTVDIKPKHSN